ncbi:DnaJ-related protein scj1 [Saitoella coloradoensis]
MRSVIFPLIFLLLLTLVSASRDFYQILNIPRTSTPQQIKSAYRSLSKKWHPDKNPDNPDAHSKFVELAAAYEVLSDPEKKEVYDKYGEEGLNQQGGGGGGRGGPGGGDPFDMFAKFFGGSGHFGQHRHPQTPRGPTLETILAVPLRSLYTGSTIPLSLEKQQICTECLGTGARSAEDVVTCGQCRGSGRVIRKHQLAPGIVQQVQMGCDKCGGKGKEIKHVCTTCHGSKVVRGTTEFEVEIEPGMMKGHKIVFEGEADESPDWEAGDLVLIIEEQEPTTSSPSYPFRRRGQDLYTTVLLPLQDALLGSWTRTIDLFGQRTITLSRARGEVVQPGHVEVREGDGMPVCGKEGQWGRMYVEYVVVLPEGKVEAFLRELEVVFGKEKGEKDEL